MHTHHAGGGRAIKLFMLIKLLGLGYMRFKYFGEYALMVVCVEGTGR